MAHGKVSLPQDLLPPPMSADSSSSSSSLFTDEVLKANAEGKALTGSLDESKDQVASESSIPLSPQWLHAKPLASATSGEMHAPGSMSHGNTTDPASRDIWRSDDSRDRKDSRKNAPELDVNRRWREEERETGLLGRRDRKKAEDHRAGGTTTRDVSENKALASDRWHESRRDNKWSSRWGPEDKDKESRMEKTDVGKEDTHADRQSQVSSNRTISERDGDSRDKWRPRHRMEVHNGGAAPYRAAPGFGMARGQVERVGFASGRGRSSTNGSLQIGSVLDQNRSVLGKSGPFIEKYRYPRGKLLDIYRIQRIESAFSIVPEGMEHVPPITQVGSVEPLAFVAPDAEEEAGMQDIWKGKITSSEVSCSSSRNKSVPKLPNDAKGIGNSTLKKDEQKISAMTEEHAINNSSPVVGAEILTICGPQSHILNERCGAEAEQMIPAVTAIADGMSSVAVKNYDDKSFWELDGLSHDVAELKISGYQNVRGFGLPKYPMSENFEPATVVIGSQIPDSSAPFHMSSLQQTSSSDHYVKGNENVEVPERIVASEDLSLCYLDPQGNIQGPFLGIDIISWFDQGFFGTDLLVCLSDAPDAPFQELGVLMPNLKTQSGLVSNPTLTTNIESLGDDGRSLEERNSGPAYEDNISHWTSSGFEATLSSDLHSTISNNVHKSELQYLDNQRFHNFVEEEEIVFPGRPKSSSDFPLRRTSADIQGSFPNSPSLPSLVNENAESNLPNRQDDKLHPFGLLMSELRGSSHLRPAQTSNVSLGMDDHAPYRDTLFEGGISHLRCAQASNVSLGMDDQAQFRDTLFEGDSSKLNWLKNSNIPMNKLLPDMEHLIEIQRQEEQQRLLIEHQRQLEFQRQQQHEFEFQRQQQRQLEIQQQHQLEFQRQQQHEFEFQRQQQRQLEIQQQHQLEIQLQHQLEIQQQRQLELQQQQQHHLELQQLQRQQQQRQLEFQQHQQRQLELQQQQRQLEIQQQLELQSPHHLQQSLRHHQMKLQQQQSAEQLLLEQLLNQQISDSYGQWKMDAARGNHHPIDLHHLSHSSRHDPSIEQIIQATMGEGALHGQTDFLDLISQAKQGNRNTSELPLRLNEQELQAQQLSLALREQMQMEGERRIGGARFTDEASPFVNDPTGHHQVHMLGFNSSENYQHQQRFSPNEHQLSHHNWNHTSQERPQGRHESNSMDFDRFSVPAGSHGLNLDIANTRGHGLGVQEQYRLNSSIEEHGSLSSGIPSHRRLLSDEFYSSHPVAFESSECGKNGQLESSSFLHLDTEQKRRVTEATMGFADSDRWASTNGDKEHSKQTFLDLHQKLGHPHAQSSVHSQPAQSSTNGDKSLKEDIYDARLPSNINKGFDSGTHRHRVLSSHDGVSEAARSLPVKPRSSISLCTSEGPAAILVSESQTSGKNETQFRRTSSYSDAGVSETSFIDVLKKPIIPETDIANRSAVDMSDGGGQIGRIVKKKGKKGRQIDPALLGFTVSSNRIMKGEIHRLDE